MCPGVSTFHMRIELTTYSFAFLWLKIKLCMWEGEGRGWNLEKNVMFIEHQDVNGFDSMFGLKERN